jgi:hypothetical protein
MPQRPKKLYSKSPKHPKQLQQCSRIQNHLTKSVALLYTKNEQIEKRYRKTIPFTISSKSIKYLRINLTKDINDLYKPLKKEIEEDYRRQKDLPLSWISRINILKMAILPISIYMLNAISTKILMTFITEIEKNLP